MRPRVWALLLTTLALSAIAAIALGSVSLSPAAVWDALRGRGAPDAEMIVRVLRLPRVVLGIVVGAGLGMSGAALQANLRNALAEPYLLGVSGGAAVGAVLATALSVTSPGVVPLAAFAGSVCAVVCVLAVARAARGPGDARVLVMAGVVVGAFANAMRWLELLASGLFAYQVTGSALAATAVVAARQLPQLLFGAFVGAVRADEVLEEDDTDDVVVGAFEYRQTRVPAVDRLLQGHGLGRVVRNQLCHLVHMPERHAQHAPHVADHGLGCHGSKSNNLRHIVCAVFAPHVINHLVAFFIAKININIGHRFF